MLNGFRGLSLTILSFTAVALLLPSVVHADGTLVPPKNAFSVLQQSNPGAFGFTPEFEGKVISLTKERMRGNEDDAKRRYPGSGEPAFISSDPYSHIVPPDQVPRVRINPQAPGPFIGMALAYQEGDYAMARAYADQYVRYQEEMLFQVRDLTQLIGEAMIRQGVIEEDSWVGVDQTVSRLFAEARNELGSPFKITHEEVLKRVAPDPEKKVEIYYFFSIDNSWSRKMAPDIERLWRLAKSDDRIKMVALTMRELPDEWIQSYRDYTGLSLPILEGAEAAKTFRVRYVPAVVMVSPTTKKAYRTTGKQSFIELYQLMRKIQDLPADVTAEVQTVIDAKIGQAESLDATKELLGGELKEKTVTVEDFRS